MGMIAHVHYSVSRVVPCIYNSSIIFLVFSLIYLDNHISLKILLTC